MLEDAEEGKASPPAGAGDSGGSLMAVGSLSSGRLLRRKKTRRRSAPQAGISAWSTDDLCEWLVSEGMEHVVGAARERQVDGRDLVYFDKECWGELGVSSALDRARLMARLRDASKEAAAAKQTAGAGAEAEGGRGVTSSGAWARLTQSVFPRSHPLVAVDHLKEWHDCIADSGRDPEEIRTIIKGHNDTYVLMFLLLYNTLLPLGFTLVPMFKIAWTADGIPADGMSIYGIAYSFYFTLLVMVLGNSVMMPLPISACIDACSTQNLVLFLKGPGNRMITDLSACGALVIYMCAGFLILSFPLLLGRDAPWYYQLSVSLGASMVAGLAQGAWVGCTDDNTSARKRIGIIDGMRDLLIGSNIEHACRLVLHAGFFEEKAVPVKPTDDAGADKTWEQIRDECALLALQNANLPTSHQDPAPPSVP